MGEIIRPTRFRYDSYTGTVIISLIYEEKTNAQKTVYTSISGMSNSNHCAGHTLSFKARKAYSGPQFGKTCYSLSILDIF